MTVLAVAADPMELKPWLARCTAPAPTDWPLPFARAARWHSHTLYAVTNGAGPRLAATAIETAAARTGPIHHILSVGLCGALDPALPLNAICTATEIGDGQSTFPAQPAPGASLCRLLSIDKFLADPAEKQTWHAQGFDAVEMEAAAAARYAAAHAIPFTAVKAVSDRAAEHFSLDFNAYRDCAGRFQRSRIALAALRHPFRFAPDLVRMASRGPAASEKLGEFLAQFRL